MEKICENCKYYKWTWTWNTHGLYFLSNSTMKHYCDNPNGKRYDGGRLRAQMSNYGMNSFDYDTCDKFENEI